MKKQLLIVLLFLPLLLLGDEKTYNKQFVIRLWDKNLQEITEIRKAFEKVAKEYELEVELEDMSIENIKWQVEWKKFSEEEEKNK